jgi:hypothetical protein
MIWHYDASDYETRRGKVRGIFGRADQAFSFVIGGHLNTVGYGSVGKEGVRREGAWRQGGSGWLNGERHGNCCDSEKRLHLVSPRFPMTGRHFAFRPDPGVLTLN